MSDSTYIQDCKNRRLIFFTGKGGVGKTSLAWSTALACRNAGMRVGVAAWGTTPQPVEGVTFVELETLSAFREYVVSVVRFEKVYDMVFDNPVLSTFVSAAPGLSDTVIGGKIWDLWDRRRFDLLLVDLPASGHAYQFFQSPHSVKKVFSVGLVNRNLNRILDLFQDPSVRLDLVTLPEELPVRETMELKEKLQKDHPPNFGFLHINRMTPHFAVEPEMPPSVESWCARYKAQKDLETSSVLPLEELHMPTLTHTRFSSHSREDTLAQLSESLEALR